MGFFVSRFRPFQAVRTIPAGMKFFTVVDALKGYLQVELDDESAALTTFSTPFGRYEYRRLPFGVSLASDDYWRRAADVFDDVRNSRRVVEDVLVFSRSYEEHETHVRHLLQRAQESGVSLNRAKLTFAETQGSFAGYILDDTGFRPDPGLTEAIRSFPRPRHHRLESVFRPLPASRKLLKPAVRGTHAARAAAEGEPSL